MAISLLNPPYHYTGTASPLYPYPPASGAVRVTAPSDGTRVIVTVTSGSLPPGITATVVSKTTTSCVLYLSGTPTTPGSYSFDLRLSDPVSLQTDSINGFAITILPTPAPPVLSTLPVAISTFGFFRWYQSYETSQGVFNEGGVVYDSGTGAFTCSAGALTAAEAGKRGLVGQLGEVANTGRTQYIGDGLPNAPVEILATGVDTINPPDYWDMSHGAWPVGDNKYVLLQADTTGFPTKHIVAMFKSTDGGATWAVMDLANSPTKLSFSSMRRSTQSPNLIDFFGYDGVTDSSGHYALNTFDTDTDTWSGYYAQQNFGRVLGLGLNGIYRFPNDDIGVYYADDAAPHALWYREWNGATWSSEVAVAASAQQFGAANMYIDPAGEILHCFKYSAGGTGDDKAPIYFKITHGGTVSADIFTFPNYSSDTDGVGNGMIYQATALGYTEPQIYAPYDHFDDNANAVWIAPLSTGQFVKHLLPVPEGEEGEHPSCAYMLFDQYPVPVAIAETLTFGLGLEMDIEGPKHESIELDLGLRMGLGNSTLQLIKVVQNTHGGHALPTAWTLNAAGPTPLHGAGGVPASPVAPGTYTLSETPGPVGYTAGTWSCTGGTQVGNQVTIGVGDTVVCTIINRDRGNTPHPPTPPTPNPNPQEECPPDQVTYHTIPAGAVADDQDNADVLIFVMQEPQEPTSF